MRAGNFLRWPDLEIFSQLTRKRPDPRIASIIEKHNGCIKTYSCELYENRLFDEKIRCFKFNSVEKTKDLAD